VSPRIHQLLSGAGPVDAVTGQALAFRRLFESWDMAGGVHAAALAPGLDSVVAPVERLAAEPGDLLLFHYSAYAPQLRELLDLPQRKLLVYHNVTPARYLWADSPHVAVQCALGRAQLSHWACGVDVACGVSEYNARELETAGAREPRVVPILFDASRLEPRAERSPAPPGDGPLVLWVGRLAPHKRPELALQAFDLYRRECEPRARLLMVGDALSRAYAASLDLPPGAKLAGALPQAELNAAFAEASVLLTLSEHEGFWVPLLEAFHLGLPVVARRAGGMAEVGGDAVLWADDRDLAVVAELIDLAVRDDERRAELARRGRERLAAAYSYEQTAAKLREAVDAALG
jgi:glycosyltransferase involved in cell wall biosynthesis